MNVCKKCGYEYDSADEFVECELHEALSYFTNADELCPDCCYQLEGQIKELINGC